jgi:hypothetical protein
MNLRLSPVFKRAQPGVTDFLESLCVVARQGELCGLAGMPEFGRTLTEL